MSYDEPNEAYDAYDAGYADGFSDGASEQYEALAPELADTYARLGAIDANIELIKTMAYARGWADGEKWVMDHLFEYSRTGNMLLRVKSWLRWQWSRQVMRRLATLRRN